LAERHPRNLRPALSPSKGSRTRQPWLDGTHHGDGAC